MDMFTLIAIILQWGIVGFVVGLLGTKIKFKILEEKLREGKHL